VHILEHLAGTGTAAGVPGDDCEMPYVESRGVSIHYKDTGPDSNTSPIVLVHGFSSSLDGNWRAAGWFDALTGAGRRVVALDCRGHGGSDKPHDPEAYSDFAMADDVLSVMDACAIERADLMGYSMGGGIALDLVLRDPQRFRSVILGGAGLRAPSTAADRQRARLERATPDNPAGFDPEALARYRQRGNDLEALAAVRLRRRPERDEAAIKQLHLPLLLVVGEFDGALAAARRLESLIPHAELEVLAGEDHLGAVASPEFKDVVLSFLARVECRRRR
jgi:pimeloyl-ACP methyl ester carboxylesterase